MILHPLLIPAALWASEGWKCLGRREPLLLGSSFKQWYLCASVCTCWVQYYVNCDCLRKSANWSQVDDGGINYVWKTMTIDSVSHHFVLICSD